MLKHMYLYLFIITKTSDSLAHENWGYPAALVLRIDVHGILNAVRKGKRANSSEGRAARARQGELGHGDDGALAAVGVCWTLL